MELVGLYLIGCTLLVLAGAMKARNPDDSARALWPLAPGWVRSWLGLRGLRMAIRAGALAECGLGLVALLWPRPLTATVVALSYLAFSALVVYVRSRGGVLTTCGCFGAPDGPATRLHAVIDLGLAVAAGVVAWHAPTEGSLATVLAQQPLHGVPLVATSGVGVWLTYLTISVRSRVRAGLS